MSIYKTIIPKTRLELYSLFFLLTGFGALCLGKSNYIFPCLILFFLTLILGVLQDIKHRTGVNK